MAETQYGRDQYGSPMEVAEAFLSSSLSGYSSASAKLQSCALEELKKPYVNLSWPCENEDCALVQLVSDLSFTIGAQLLSEMAGGPRYRYLMETNRSGHGDDLCLFYDMQSENCPQKAGQMLREYWTSFAKTGRPSSVLGPEWLPVERSEDVPMMYLNFTSDGSTSAMRSTTFSSAKLFARVACGKVTLQGSSNGGCMFAFN